jgi:hypothetical protein
MARRAGKPPSQDTTVTLSIQELMLASGREFVQKLANEPVGS